jgi:Holliday junction resolvase
LNYRKGAQAERKLIEKLREEGFACVRVAGSGRARFEQPDVIASNGKRVMAIECKHVNSDCVYIPKEEINALLKFSREFGAEPVLAVRFKKRWCYWALESVGGVESKNHSFKKGNGKDSI